MIAPVSVATLFDAAERCERERSGGSGATVDRLLMPDGGVVYVKAGQGEAADGIAAEMARLRWLQGRLPVPAVLDFHRDGRGAWLVTSALRGITAGAWLSGDPASTPHVVAGLAAFLRRLHAIPADDCPFDSSVAAWLPVARERVASGLVDADDFDDDHHGRSAGEILADVERLAGAAAGRVVVHGDFTLGNILIDPDGRVAGCLDVGRLGTADPYQDISLLWRDLGGVGEAAQTAFLAAIGLPRPDPHRLLLHRSLDELF